MKDIAPSARPTDLLHFKIRISSSSAAGGPQGQEHGVSIESRSNDPGVMRRASARSPTTRERMKIEVRCESRHLPCRVSECRLCPTRLPRFPFLQKLVLTVGFFFAAVLL